MRTYLLICCAIISLLLLKISFAQDTHSEQCGDVVEMVRNTMKSINVNDYFVVTLQRKGQAYYMLFVSFEHKPDKESKDTVITPWRLLERQGQSLNYCLIAGGIKSEPLKSMQDANPQKRFGMPGSGYPRCTNGDDPLSTIDMQLWANKELGESFVTYLTSDIGSNNFLFMMSNDGYWILINNDKNNLNDSCYYSRGDSVLMNQQAPKVKH